MKAKGPCLSVACRIFQNRGNRGCTAIGLLSVDGGEQRESKYRQRDKTRKKKGKKKLEEENKRS
jgi:hypothetical protein